MSTISTLPTGYVNNGRRDVYDCIGEIHKATDVLAKPYRVADDAEGYVAALAKIHDLTHELELRMRGRW